MVMAALVVGLVLLLAMAVHSDGSYCVCNSNLSDTVLQTNIDYACGAGADCSDIHQNGACYNPNTVRDHCNYAVNSYYQRKGQVAGSCDFKGTATVTQTAPNAVSGCVYESSASNGGSTTNTSTGGGTTTTGGTTTGSTTTGGTFPGTTVSPNNGLGPTGSGFADNSAGVAMSSRNNIFMMFILCLFPLHLLVAGLMQPRM